MELSLALLFPGLFDLVWMSPGFCDSLLLLLRRGPAPFTVPFTPLTAAAFCGCLKPDGGLLEFSKGDGDD